jgi:hypothetical protein
MQIEIWTTRDFWNTKQERYCLSQINMPRRNTLEVGKSPPLNLCRSTEHHGCHIVCSQRRCCQHYYTATLDNPVPAMTMWPTRWSVDVAVPLSWAALCHSPPTLPTAQKLIASWIPQICLHDHTSTQASNRLLWQTWWLWWVQPLQ